MRKLALVCAGLALFASVVSFMLWRDLRAERELSAGLRNRLAEVEARAPVVVAASPSPTAPPPAAAPATTDKPPATKETPLPVMTRIMSMNNVSISERDMLKDPEYRKARLAQTRLTIAQQYPGLAEALGLSPEAADRLFDLLAENQLEMNSSTALVVGPNGQIDQTQLQEMSRLRQQLQARQEAALSTMLGDSVYAKWQQYQQTQPARQQVMQLGRALESAGLPLTEAQLRPLIDAMATEQARQAQETQAMFRDMGTSQGPPDPQALARLQDESFKRQADSNRRLLDVAASSLSARQLDVLRATLDQQLTMNRVSSRLLREAQERNQQAAPAGP